MPTASFSAVACGVLGVGDLVAGIGMTARLIYIHSKSEGESEEHILGSCSYGLAMTF
jgi:hypothetical protein